MRAVAGHGRAPEVVGEDLGDGAGMPAAEDASISDARGGGGGGNVGVAEDGLHVVVHKVPVEAAGRKKIKFE